MSISNVPISRRSMLGLSSAALATLALGDTLFVLSGCSSNESSGDIILKLADKEFSVSSTSGSTAFSGVKLSLLPGPDAQNVELLFKDTAGDKQVTTIAPDDKPIIIQGNGSFLTVDDTAFKGNLSIDAETNIYTLLLGGIEHVEIAGTVHFLVIAGTTDVTLKAGANVEYIIVSDSRTDISVEKDATAGFIYTPYKNKVVDQGGKATIEVVDGEYAKIVCRVCVRAAETGISDATSDELAKIISEEIAARASKNGGSAQANATASLLPLGGIFGLKKAYADEAEDGEGEGKGEGGGEAEPELSEEDIDAEYEADGVDIVDLDSDDAAEHEELDDDELEVVDEDAAEDFVDTPVTNGGLIEDKQAKAALEKVGGLVLSGVSDFALPYLEDAIFGPGTSDEGKFKLMLEKLDELEFELKKVYNELKTSEYASIINAFIADYKADAETWISQITIDDDDMVKKNPDPDDLKKARLAYACDLMWPDGRQVYMVHNEGIVSFASRLCSAITQFYVSVAADLFDAYFNLCLLNNPWEHHTIDGRFAFQDTIVDEITAIVGFATYAIRGAFDTYKDDTSDEGTEKRLECERAWNHLMALPEDPEQGAQELGVSADELTKVLNEDNDSGEVKGLAIAAKDFVRARLAAKHDDDVRYFMAPGCELALYSQSSIVKSDKKGTEQKQFMHNSAGDRVPTFAEFEAMRKYYKDTYGQSKSYYDIIFDDDAAGIAMPPDHSKKNKHFSVSEKIDYSRVHQGTVTHYEYWLRAIAKDGKHKDLKFAECEELGYGTQTWTWRIVDAFAVFIPSDL